MEDTAFNNPSELTDLPTCGSQTAAGRFFLLAWLTFLLAYTDKFWFDNG